MAAVFICLESMCQGSMCQGSKLKQLSWSMNRAGCNY